jgi:hypothetical protein
MDKHREGRFGINRYIYREKTRGNEVGVKRKTKNKSTK